MKMGTSQKQNISVQHRIWNANRKPTILTCEQWRNRRFCQMVEAGAKIGFNRENQVFRIEWPEKEPIIVSQAEIRADYEKCYLRKGVTA